MVGCAADEVDRMQAGPAFRANGGLDTLDKFLHDYANGTPPPPGMPFGAVHPATKLREYSNKSNPAWSSQQPLQHAGRGAMSRYTMPF